MEGGLDGIEEENKTNYRTHTNIDGESGHPVY